MVSRTQLYNGQKESYLAQYEVEEEDIKEQIMSPANSNKQEGEKQAGFKNVFTSPFIYSYQNLQSQLGNYVENTQP